MSYREEVKINKYCLDDELEKLPSQVQEYGELLHDMVEEKDNKDLELAIYEAKLDEEIRNLNAKITDKKDKFTEPQIKNKIIKDVKRVQLAKECNKLKKKVGYLKVATDAFGKKNTNVNSLCELYLANYFTNPYVKKNEDDRYRDKIRKDLNKEG